MPAALAEAPKSAAELLAALSPNELVDFDLRVTQIARENVEKIITAALDDDRLPDPPGPVHLVRRHFAPEELATFARAGLGLDDSPEGRHRLAKEISRVRVIREQQQIAGTSADRAAAREAAQRAAGERDRRTPELQEQIARLESQVAELARTAAAAARTVERQDRAVGVLREKVPAHVHEAFAGEKGRIKASFSEELQSLQNELIRCQRLLAIDPETEPGRDELARLKSSMPANYPGREHYDPSTWSKARTAAAETLARVQPEFAAAKARQAAAIAEAEREILGIYDR